MKDFLTPAAIIILALTQIPGMVESHNFNRCVAGVREFWNMPSSDIERETFHTGKAINRCR